MDLQRASGQSTEPDLGFRCACSRGQPDNVHGGVLFIAWLAILFKNIRVISRSLDGLRLCCHRDRKRRFGAIRRPQSVHSQSMGRLLLQDGF